MKKYRVKLFQNRGAQTVRLPKNCKFKTSEVLVYRQGKTVVIEPLTEPLDEWSEDFIKCLGSVKSKIPRLKQHPVTESRNPFE